MGREGLECAEGSIKKTSNGPHVLHTRREVALRPIVSALYVSPLCDLATPPEVVQWMANKSVTATVE